MMIVKYRWFFFALSALLVIASLVGFGLYGLKLGIDFTGGTLVEMSYTTAPDKSTLESSLAPLSLGTYSVRQAGSNDYIIRTRNTTQEERTAIVAELSKIGTDASVKSVASIGPTLGTELARKSIVAIVLVIVAIVFYIAFAFRKVSRPISSWGYGIIAVITLIHDVIIPVGVFAWLGYFIGIEVDALFVAAILTVLGFSVHDTIVVFDRTRENLKLNQQHGTNEDFELTVGKSVRQTFTRSINTSMTVVIVLLLLFFFGSATTQDFTLALLIGIVAGTYSSICLASPLLVAWERMRAAKK